MMKEADWMHLIRWRASYELVSCKIYRDFFFWPAEEKLFSQEDAAPWG